MRWTNNGETVLETDADYIAAFLDWFNNFLTVSRFADYYGWSDEMAILVIDEGRELHALSNNDYDAMVNLHGGLAP